MFVSGKKVNCFKNKLYSHFYFVNSTQSTADIDMLVWATSIFVIDEGSVSLPNYVIKE